MIIGTTFSHRHLKYMKLDIDRSLEDLLSLKLGIVRLGVYWDEAQPDQGKFDFSGTRKLMDFCEKNGQDVVLTIGMKAPRWPEFYLPRWLKNKKPSEIENEILIFIEKSVKEFAEYKCLKYWQIENEPLDPSGPEKLTVPFQILAKEGSLIRRLDKRPLIVNLWGNQLSKRKVYLKTLEIADVIGIDLYYKTPWIRGYHGPKDSDGKMAKILQSLGKPFWFTELQAEPWERDELVAFSDRPPSINEVLLKENFERAKSMNSDAILLWGFEYWLLKKKNGNDLLWKAVKEIVSGN